jgi:hypothetical protein
MERLGSVIRTDLFLLNLNNICAGPLYFDAI